MIVKYHATRVTGALRRDIPGVRRVLIARTDGLAFADDGPEREELRGRLHHAARLLREERFPAVAGEQCRDCSFVPVCPIKSAGSVVQQ